MIQVQDRVTLVTAICSGFRSSSWEDVPHIRMTASLYKLLQDKDGTPELPSEPCQTVAQASEREVEISQGLKLSCYTSDNSSCINIYNVVNYIYFEGFNA